MNTNKISANKGLKKIANNAILCKDVTKRLLVFLRHNELIGEGSYNFNDMADIFIEYSNLVKPINVTHKDFIYQLYSNGELPMIEGYAATNKPSPKKETYSRQLKDNRWQLLRFKVLRRDGGKCQLCDKDTNLQIHHKRYIHGKKAWEYPLDLLITLCGGCHSKFHGKKKRTK